jgi:hypothetical protein
MPVKATSPFPDQYESESVSSEEKLALIERIAASEHFRRSARLRDFLLYVGRQSLTDHAAELNEQDIGAHVFGRDAGYDRSQDNIVRVNATELRKRIEHYFSTDGAEEVLVLEIPRGGYRPIFHRRDSGNNTIVGPVVMSAADHVHAAEPVMAAAAPMEAKRTNIAKFAWPIACSILLAVSIMLYVQKSALEKRIDPLSGKPAVAAFWNNFVGNRQQVDLVLPDDSMSVVEDITNRPISLGDYINHNFGIDAAGLSADRQLDARQVLGHNLVTFGGLRAEERVASVIPHNIITKTWLSHYYSPDLINSDNVVLIGGEKANPWVHLFDDKLNFVTSYDYDKNHPHGFVSNAKPQPGEQARYDTGGFGYSVLAYVPNLAHTSNVIILAGTDSDATGAAAEFLLSEEKMENFAKMLHVTKLPYFEILLRTSGLNGASFNTEIVAYRVH